jgi:DNA ligase-1
MEELLGKIKASLQEKEVEGPAEGGEEISDELIFLINSRIKPPKPVTKEDVYIRTMFLVSDEVNSYGGRFPIEELPKIAELVIDSPVIVGHTKERLPIARNFKAELAERNGKKWVKVWFYWLKNSKDALSLKENIDHGIYKECSLGFVFEFPECGICGEDMRRCQHIPFKTYETPDGGKEGFFNYRNITKVLETSLVYRGAVPNTSMSDELLLYQKHECKGQSCKLGRIYKEVVEGALNKAGLSDQAKLVGGVCERGYSDHDLDIICPPQLEVLVFEALPLSYRSKIHFVQSLSRSPHPSPLGGEGRGEGEIKEKATQTSPFDFIPPTKPKKSNSSSNEIFHLDDLTTLEGEFLIEPKYDGVRAQIHRKEKGVRIFTDEGNRIEDKFPHLVKDILAYAPESFILDGEMVKYKGNSRLSHKEVAGYIHDKNDPAKGEEDSHFKFKLFDILYLNGEDLTSLSLEQRKKSLEENFPDTNFVHKVKYEKSTGEDLLSKIKNLATSEGAMIKRSDSKYFDQQDWYKWKRYFELDALVRGVEKNKGGSYNYTCAVGSRSNPVPIGTTYSTKVEAQVGDIIRVRVDYITKSDDRFTWYAPKVLDRRSDKKEPDPISVLERMIDERMSADRSQQSAAKNSEAADGRLPTADRFVLQLHWWGKAKHHDLRFQKSEGKVAIGLTLFELDLDGLDQGRRFLCEWKDYHDPKWLDFEGEIPPSKGDVEGNPSTNYTAYMKILDSGHYKILERKNDFTSFEIEGKILNGIYMVRKVKLKGKDRWLFWKRSTDKAD